MAKASRAVPEVPAIDPKGLSTPIPVRFDQQDRNLIESLERQTKLPKAHLIRLAVAYAIPRFLSGEASLADLTGSEGER